jgi:hypothetical protein
MPETSIDKDNGFESPQHDIRLARKILHVKSISITHTVEERSYNELRLRVARSNPRHYFTSLFSCPDVQIKSLDELDASR